MSIPHYIKQVDNGVWEIGRDFKKGMNVPARIYATESLLNKMEESVTDQVTNVAKLKGIVNHAFCMPDGHWGYGFPIGGVAAMDATEGVISPGGIGFDINCGMRLAVTNLTVDEVSPQLQSLINQLFKCVPCGVGGKGMINISRGEFRDVIEQGAKWAVNKGYGWNEDLERTEEEGCITGADASCVSQKAIERGFKQIGTLGSGNHYLEIQVASPENVYDKALAQTFGITKPNQIVIMFHCGSRGFGHQVATDYLQIFLNVMKSKYGLEIIDRELACAPFHSPEGQDYFKAMKCAVNMAFANRQVILHRIREVFADVFKTTPQDLGIHQVYDVAHNIAKLEKHQVNGKEKEVLVHRKGATRALGPGMDGLPEVYKRSGQPVIIGGSMETGSYLLAGTEGSKETFCSTAHGSGRTMSRTKARKQFYGRDLQKKLKDKGIYIQCASYAGLAEEAGAAYKNIDDVVKATEVAGISKKVARFTPIGNIKG
ncbi:MAG: RtcB family protein [Candidatus Omnitrophica bacterium]|nr:RtcB family protein [Candidatus Omnitrophota bacterium]